MAPAPVLLTARGLAARRGERTVLEGVDLELRAGEVVAVLGPNGAGKSTLLAVLAGLLAPSAGTVARGGRVAAVLQAPALARRSALANVEAGLAWWGAPRRARRDRALAALRRLGVEPLAHRHARELSGGEARRVHLARTLVVEPAILLLDEPFAGLDASTRAELIYDAASVLRAGDRATLVVVHDRAEAWALADRVMILLEGRVAADGSPEAVFESPPSPAVAAFVGFVGRLREPGGTRLLRPVDVALDPDGPLAGPVVRRVPLEEGVRVEVEVPDGRLVAIAPVPGPALGERVGLRAEGGVRFASDVLAGSPS